MNIRILNRDDPRWRCVDDCMPIGDCYRYDVIFEDDEEGIAAFYTKLQIPFHNFPINQWLGEIAFIDRHEKKPPLRTVKYWLDDKGEPNERIY